MRPTCRPCRTVYRGVQPCVVGVACCSTAPGCNPLESDNRKSLGHPGKFHHSCNLQWGKRCTCFRDIRVERRSSRILDEDSSARNLTHTQKNHANKVSITLLVKNLRY